MRGKFDAAAAGQQQIVDLLNTLISQQQGNPPPTTSSLRGASDQNQRFISVRSAAARASSVASVIIPTGSVSQGT